MKRIGTMSVSIEPTCKDASDVESLVSWLPNALRFFVDHVLDGAEMSVEHGDWAVDIRWTGEIDWGDDDD